jgi:ribosomal-protein-alanine N-acetyltransferase
MLPARSVLGCHSLRQSKRMAAQNVRGPDDHATEVPDDHGRIEYFPITHYLQGFEISYQLFGSQHAGRGYTTEAVNLLVGYLFGAKRVNRMQLNIHPGNAASKRVAEKCGFTFEGLMRGCWFHQGQYHDLEIWSLLRDEASNVGC